VDGGAQGVVEDEAKTSNCREMNESEFIVALRATNSPATTTAPWTTKGKDIKRLEFQIVV
jgi:hypothetical protein